MNEFNKKLDGGEERMGELEDRSDKLFRMQRHTRWKMCQRSPETQNTKCKDLPKMLIGVRRSGENGTGKVFRERGAGNF